MADRRHDGARGPDAGVGPGRDGDATFTATCSACSYAVVIHEDAPDDDWTDTLFDLQEAHQQSYGNHHVLEFDRSRASTSTGEASTGEAAED